MQGISTPTGKRHSIDAGILQDGRSTVLMLVHHRNGSYLRCTKP